MAPSRLAAATVFAVTATAGSVGSLLYTGRMARAVSAIEGRRRSYLRPALLTWSDYSRLCPRGPLTARLWQANSVFVIGLIGIMLSLG